MIARKFNWCIYINTVLLIVLSIYFFFYPAITILHEMQDPGLKAGNVPHFTFGWHRSLSRDYAVWAQERVASGEAAGLNINNISGTEWPVFGTVFYLSSTESLQQAWEKDPTLYPVAPAEYALDAIEASAALVADPGHAGWVRQHWGDDYLSRENLFYRMLLISGLTSYQKLTGNDQYEDLLREQVESLSKELDESAYGLLDDYPGQCYPVDILPAIAAIQRADKVLGTDHSQFVQRALRGFQGGVLDEETGLPAYIADSRTGVGYGPARGAGISFMLIGAPELWPVTSQEWYANYENYFWKQTWATAGFREFSRDLSYGSWAGDVDSGPILAGYGTAASAFGIGAARAFGRYDHSYPLSVEALSASWPLPDGTRLGPRMLSNLSDAPYIGEVSLLFALTRLQITEGRVPTNGFVPASAYFGISFYLIMGIAFSRRALRSLDDWKKNMTMPIPNPKLQFTLWCIFSLIGLVSFFLFDRVIGLFCLLLAQTFPSGNRIGSWLIDYDFLKTA
ncbi:MAG: hypothetical protein JNM55_08755 [Anaerolineales bacterium]|nr:hypothetical protein [Anaerolineales bacterium]